MTRLLALFAVLAAFGAAGCGSKGDSGGSDSTKSGVPMPKTATSTVKEGWTEVKSSGFSLHVPPKWKAIDLTSSELDQIIDAASKENEGVRMSASQFKALASQGMVKLMVFGEVDTSGPFAENMNVVVTDAPSSVTTDMMMEGYKAQMKAMAAPGTEPGGAAFSMPAGDAVKMHTEISMVSGNAKSVASLAYMVAKDGKLYTITFSCLPGRASQMESTADEVMQTLKID